MNHEQRTVLEVQGMSCPSCVRHINEALRDVAGVKSVEVRLADGKVLVRHEGEGATPAVFVAALAEAGYDATPVPR